MPTIELYGQARLLAGVRSLQVAGSTVEEALQALAAARPALVGTVLYGEGRLTPAYAVNINGLRFCANPAEPLAHTDELLIISSLSGG